MFALLDSRISSSLLEIILWSFDISVSGSPKGNKRQPGPKSPFQIHWKPETLWYWSYLLSNINNCSPMLVTIEKTLLYPFKKKNLASDTFLRLCNILQTAADGMNTKYTWNQEEPGAQPGHTLCSTNLEQVWGLSDLGSLQHFSEFSCRMCLWLYPMCWQVLWCSFL